jgi:hypothetical protein
MSSTTTTSGGIGLCGATFLLLLALRLTDHIDWAWYWVAAPLWMPAGLVMFGLVACGVAFLIIESIEWLANGAARRRRRAARQRSTGGKP